MIGRARLWVRDWTLRASRRFAATLPREPRRRLDLPMEPDRIYAIGDIHGCIEKLRGLEAAIVEDCRGFSGDCLIVYLGDYVDRGPDSAAVIDQMIGPALPGFQKICLCGNHEEVLIDVLDGRTPVSDWLQIGGVDTLLSYGFDIHYMTRRRHVGGRHLLAAISEALPPHHVEFLRRLPAAFTTLHHIFVHAGLRPGLSVADQKEHDLLWIRKSFLEAVNPEFGRRVVHGHTPGKAPFVDEVRINVDTGAYLGGPLTAVRLEGGTVGFLKYGAAEPIADGAHALSRSLGRLK